MTPWPLSLIVTALIVLLLLRTILSFGSILYALKSLWRWLDDHTQSHQTFVVPRLTASGQQNPFHRRAASYVAALPSLDDASAAEIFSAGRKPNDFHLLLGPAHAADDHYLGARLTWSNDLAGDRLVLRLRRRDRARVLRPYLQHVETAADDLDLRRREIRLFTAGDGGGGRWRAVAFTHPATMETVAMDQDLKSRVRADLEAFVKGRAYYHRLGRVWRRSYLLYGPPGTGKSTFVAAMAKSINFDIYDLDASRLKSGSDDLKALLLSTTPRSIILIEELDRFLKESGSDFESRLAGILSFMDGIFSCCGEERVMVFTMTTAPAISGEDGIEPAVLRPGRIDVHVHFPLCDFSAFRFLASNYLGLTEHKLYNQVEEVFQNGAKISPAEVGEIMIANRGSPSRALKTVISALQQSSSSSGEVIGRRVGGDQKVLIDTAVMRRSGELMGAERRSGGASPTTVGKKWYGLIKMKSGSRKEVESESTAINGGDVVVKGNS